MFLVAVNNWVVNLLITSAYSVCSDMCARRSPSAIGRGFSDVVSWFPPLSFLPFLSSNTPYSLCTVCTAITCIQHTHAIFFFFFNCSIFLHWSPVFSCPLTLVWSQPSCLFLGRRFCNRERGEEMGESGGGVWFFVFLSIFLRGKKGIQQRVFPCPPFLTLSLSFLQLRVLLLLPSSRRLCLVCLLSLLKLPGSGMRERRRGE